MEEPVNGEDLWSRAKYRRNLNTFSANASQNKTIDIPVPTSAFDVGALPDTTKYGSSLLITINSTTYVVTAQLKDQNGDNLGSAQTIDLPLESVVVGGYYDDNTKKVILTLQNGNTIEFSVANLVSGLQSEITAQNPLSADLLTDGSTNKVYTATEQSKLANIAANAEVNVQSDWNESDSSSDAYVKNKPSIPAAQIQSDWNQSDNTQLDYIKNKPAIPAAQVNADWEATSGAAEILHKPIFTVIITPNTSNNTTTYTYNMTAKQFMSHIANGEQPLFFVRPGTYKPNLNYGYFLTENNISSDADGGWETYESELYWFTSAACTSFHFEVWYEAGPPEVDQITFSYVSETAFVSPSQIPSETYIGTGTGWGQNQVIGAFLRSQYFLNGDIPQKVGDYVYSTTTRCLHKITSISTSNNELVANATFIAFFSGFDGNYNSLSNKPAAIPTPTSADEDKLLSVDSNGEYELKNNDGSNFVTYDNGVVATSATVTFANGKRKYQYLSTQQNLQLSFVVQNSTDNYLLIESTNPTIPITITIVSADINNPDPIIQPATAIQIPALQYVELSVTKLNSIIMVTASEPLVKTSTI